MKYTKYIAILSTLLFTACATELIEPSLDLDGNDMVQLVSRVIPFSDRDVATRANKNDAEVNVSSIAYFIFQKDGKCIFHERVTTTDPLSIDRSSSELANYDLTECYIISIANAPEFNVTPGETTWGVIASQTVSVSGVAIPSGGLAMIGRYPEGENTFINLNATAPGEVLTIPMQSVFSKIKVNINVDSDQIIPGENQPLPTFTLKGAEVHNVASAVDFIGGNESGAGLIDGTNDDTAVNTESYVIEAFGETSDGGTAVSFSFYLPERFLRAGTSASDFQYPFGKGTAIRAEDMDYRQRYKPMLAKGYPAYNSSYDQSKDKKATYVTINGTYSDHQGNSFNVSYDIYVGRDNYGNFDIVRNTQYNNNVTIRGINNSSDQSTDKAAVSIDHRVNVERLDPIIVNFRRETLLDSHFEVRPLRVRKNPNFTGVLTNAKVKIEVAYDKTPTSNWIGLERSFGDGNVDESSSTYLVDNDLAADRKNSAGKRKYFTTDLTTNTLKGAGTIGGDGFSTAGGKTVIVPVTDANQCVWIYVDECVTPGDAVRSAKIKVSYATDGTTYSTPVEYVINQRLVFPVTYEESETVSRSYNIEYHEEYLYNYDSEDQFGQTDFEGMPWGLNGAQLSFDELSLEFGSGLADYFTGNLKPYYDFYIKKHDSAATGTLFEYNGYVFMNSIITDVNTKDNTNRVTGINETIDVLNLATDPSSAIEYCYNKNKRNSEGHVVSMNWYLPAIDEMEDIVMGGYSTFLVFQNNYYWSCQPSYIRNYAYYDGPLTSIFGGGPKHGPYYIDDKNYARATKVEYLGNDLYSYAYSGVEANNYYNGWYHYELGFWKDDRIVESGNWTNGITTTLGTISREEGNHLRTKKNRIRCVYKAN